MALNWGKVSLRRIILWCALLATILAANFFISDPNMLERSGTSLVRETLSQEEIALAEYQKLENEVLARTAKIVAEVAELTQ